MALRFPACLWASVQSPTWHEKGLQNLEGFTENKSKGVLFGSPDLNFEAPGFSKVLPELVQGRGHKGGEMERQRVGKEGEGKKGEKEEGKKREKKERKKKGKRKALTRCQKDLRCSSCGGGGWENG